MLELSHPPNEVHADLFKDIGIFSALSWIYVAGLLSVEKQKFACCFADAGHHASSTE